MSISELAKSMVAQLLSRGVDARWKQVVVLVAATFWSCIAGTASAATLKIATLSPEGSVWMKVLRKHGAKIAQMTDGEVKLKFYPGGVMGDDKAVLRKMRVGQLHGAVVTAGGLVQSYKDITLYNLPMVFQNTAEVDYVRQRMDGKLMDGLRSNKFVGFGFAEVGFAFPMSQKNVTSVAGVRGLKVWTPDNDPASLKAFDAFKISPIPLPIADVLTGLQTGLIDSVATPPIGAIALQWYTQVEYGLQLPLMYIYGLFAVTEKSFARLSPEHQTIVHEQLSAAVRIVDESARKDHTSAMQALSKQGFEWLLPDRKETDEWWSVAAAATDRLIQQEYVTPALYSEMMEHLAQYRAAGATASQ